MVVTLNPALDITHVIDRADWAGVNRPHTVHVRAGGKGVNVSRTLRALGADVTLAGLAGGGAGRELAAGLSGTGIVIALTQVAGETRRTFAVVDTARGETALFNEPGPRVSEGEYLEFFVIYRKTLAICAAVVLSGSLPPGVPDGAYADLIAAAAAASVPVILDASGAALAAGVAAGPALVKPNLGELAELTGRSLHRPGGLDADAVIAAGGSLVAAGARAAVVSLGPRGLLAITGEGYWRASPAGQVAGNPTGAGDAVVAALAHGLVRRQEWPERLRHAAAIGAASVAAPAAGEFHADTYQRHLAEVEVTALAGPGAGVPGAGGSDTGRLVAGQSAAGRSAAGRSAAGRSAAGRSAAGSRAG
jgi:tagatose 6-phosphate kinase